MPRFYLHLRQGENFFPDPEGAVFADLEAARLETLQAARELAAESVKFDQAIEGQFEITDEQEQILLTVAVKDAVRIKP